MSFLSAFIEDEYFCPNCGATLNDQDGFDPDDGTWVCTECGQHLYGGEIEETMNRFPGVVWYCDSCGAVLNKQSGFDDDYSGWICTECGHCNGISEEEIQRPVRDAKESEKENESQRTSLAARIFCGILDSLGNAIAEPDDEDTETDEDYETGNSINECPNCGADLKRQYDFDEDDLEAECESCGVKLYRYAPDEEFEIAIRHEQDQESTEIFSGNVEENRSAYDDVDGSVFSNLYRSRKSESHSSGRDDADAKIEQRERTEAETKVMLFLAGVLALILAVSLLFDTLSSRVAVGFTPDDLIGKTSQQVTELLESSGFTNIVEYAIPDLDSWQAIQENIVTDVIINGDENFKAKTKYFPTVNVRIVYHTLKCFEVPLSSKDAKGQSYLEVKKTFENAGFDNISLVPEYDVVLGWFADDGEVKSVAIDGNTRFKAGDQYKVNAEIVITYHALKKNKGQE